MTASAITVEATLQPDGVTLQLEKKLALPPGRVIVTVQSAELRSPTQETWWQYMQKARSQLEASGHRFMNEQEMTAWIEELRSDDDRIERAYGPARATEPEK
jgi:hypothetical protein